MRGIKPAHIKMRSFEITLEIKAQLRDEGSPEGQEWLGIQTRMRPLV